MQPNPIAGDLRILYAALRRHSCLGEPLPPATCRRLAGALARLARKADVIDARAAEADELEDELLAVARRIEQEEQASLPPGYQAALKAQQLEIQRELDAGGPAHVSRAGLAALSIPIGDSNVFAFPIAPHSYRPVDDGDAA